MNVGLGWEEHKKAEPVTVTVYCNTRNVKNAAQKVCKEKKIDKKKIINQQNRIRVINDIIRHTLNEMTHLVWGVMWYSESSRFFSTMLSRHTILWWWFKHQQHLSVQMTERYIFKYFQTVFNHSQSSIIVSLQSQYRIACTHWMRFMCEIQLFRIWNIWILMSIHANMLSSLLLTLSTFST